MTSSDILHKCCTNVTQCIVLWHKPKVDLEDLFIADDTIKAGHHSIFRVLCNADTVACSQHVPLVDYAAPAVSIGVSICRVIGLAGFIMSPS